MFTVHFRLGSLKIVGTAKGFSYGSAFKLEYVLLVPVKGKEIKITFDDWIFKQSDTIAINRAKMTKFGFRVADLTVVFVKINLTVHKSINQKIVDFIWQNLQRFYK